VEQARDLQRLVTGGVEGAQVLGALLEGDVSEW
jgi:hypothetical protein